MKTLSISEYFAMDRSIDKKKKIKSSMGDPRIVKIALAGSFTLNGIKEALNVKCHEAGLVLKPYVGEYGRYNQDLLEKKSRLYKFKPDLTIILIDTKDLLGENYHFPYRLSAGKRRAFIRERVKYLRTLIGLFKKNGTGKLIINNFSVPVYSPLGPLENKQEFGFFEMVRSLNRELEESYRRDPGVYIFDYDNFLSRCGKNPSFDDKMSYLADMKLNPNFIPLLCDEYMGYIKALKGKTRKCIVLDLDNTLWGGIVGEDGFNGIRLGPTPPGNAFMEFQKHLLNLFERGIILAINSNNNEEEALKVIREHPYMILREEHFASIKINWNNKAQNIAEIAKEVNIGLDSIIYIDDDKANRQLVGEMLDGVRVLDLPEDPALYSKALKECGDLSTLRITEEDMKRGVMYAQERKRKAVRGTFGNLEEFLKHLDMEVNIEALNGFSIPRISQLTQRTNQFNFTVRRYQEEDVRRLSGEKGYGIYFISAKDKFGDHGISGMVSFRKEADGLFVDNFLLSCRILGKGIEESVLAFLTQTAKKIKAKRIIFEYRPTEKNGVVRKFLKDSSMKPMGKRKGNELWKLEIRKDIKTPPHIRMIVK